MRDCNDYRRRIPERLLEDLAPAEAAALDAHLAECAGCRSERDEYASALGFLRSDEARGDVDVPRHFFVYEERGRGGALARLPWKLVALAATAAVVLAVTAAARLEVQTGAGWVTLRFGSRPAPAPAAAAADLQALEARISKAADERAQRDRLELARALREELARAEGALTERQRRLVATTAAALERRFDTRLGTTAASLRSENREWLATLYRTLDDERRRDVEAVVARLDRMAATGEIRSNQTEAILTTLLEVADLRLDRTSR